MAALKEKRTCGQRCEDFGHFVWNSDNGTLMGRTPEKWVYISLYYVAFYIVMTSLFCLAIWYHHFTKVTTNPEQTYNDTLQRGCDQNCTKGKYFLQNFTAHSHTKKSCCFPLSLLGPCSGLQDPNFGYNCTMPYNGILDKSYFPYYGRLAQPQYLNPLVAVRVDLVNQQWAKLQCRVVADHISYENIHDPYEGKVVFSLKNLKKNLK
ncbi:hypothetical protein CRUP_017427 [Coryphaenoides rupestris]|nr:hypothetical protein CRUP_017427 [Coryphaenoides rupestris]